MISRWAQIPPQADIGGARSRHGTIKERLAAPVQTNHHSAMLLIRYLTPVLGALFFYVSTATAQSKSNSTLVLEPGDVIHIEVWRNKELTGDFPIANDGTITHPLYRDLVVAGLPLDSVRSMLRTFLSKYETNPAFTITPMLRIIVAGDVRQPNLLTVPAGTTVAQAIALAGGPTDRARLDRVRVVRRSGAITLDNTTDTMLANTELRSGDEIFVPHRRNFMQDVLAPSSSILAAVAAVTTVVLQATRR